MPQQFKPHYAPGTLRSHFSVEQVLTTPSGTLRTTFPPESPLFPTSSHDSSFADQHAAQGISSLLQQLSPAPKPYSEANHSQNTNPNAVPDVHSSTRLEQSNPIPKPSGEAGRPSNGYNLKYYCTNKKSPIGWSDAEFSEAQIFLDGLVDKHLDYTRSRTKQSDVQMGLLCTEAFSKFPILKRCEDNWLLHDFVMVRLKWWKHPDRTKPGSSSAGDGSKHTSRANK